MITNKLTCLAMGRKIKNLKRCYFKFYIIVQVLSINQKQTQSQKSSNFNDMRNLVTNTSFVKFC